MSRALYERFDPLTTRHTVVTTDAESGQPIFRKSQHTTPIVDSAKALASSYDRHVRREVTHVARIPLVVWQRLEMLGITNDDKALAAWLDSREARAFRCDDARRI